MADTEKQRSKAEQALIDKIKSLEKTFDLLDRRSSRYASSMEIIKSENESNIRVLQTMIKGSKEWTDLNNTILKKEKELAKFREKKIKDDKVEYQFREKKRKLEEEILRLQKEEKALREGDIQGRKRSLLRDQKHLNDLVKLDQKEVSNLTGRLKKLGLLTDKQEEYFNDLNASDKKKIAIADAAIAVQEKRIQKERDLYEQQSKGVKGLFTKVLNSVHGSILNLPIISSIKKGAEYAGVKSKVLGTGGVPLFGGPKGEAKNIAELDKLKEQQKVIHSTQELDSSFEHLVSTIKDFEDSLVDREKEIKQMDLKLEEEKDDVDVTNILNENLAKKFKEVEARNLKMEGEPELATGGIVNKRTKAVIGEKGPEAVIPLDKIKGFLGSKEISMRKDKKNLTDIWEILVKIFKKKGLDAKDLKDSSGGGGGFLSSALGSAMGPFLKQMLATAIPMLATAGWIGLITAAVAADAYLLYDAVNRFKLLRDKKSLDEYEREQRDIDKTKMSGDKLSRLERGQADKWDVTYNPKILAEEQSAADEDWLTPSTRLTSLRTQKNVPALIKNVDNTPQPIPTQSKADEDETISDEEMKQWEAELMEKQTSAIVNAINKNKGNVSSGIPTPSLQ